MSQITYPGVYIDEVVVSEASAVPLAILTDAALGVAPTNLLFSRTLQKDGGSSSPTWSIVSGVNDAWLSINPSTGELSGTPTSADLGVGSVLVRVEEPADPTNFDEKTFRFRGADIRLL